MNKVLRSAIMTLAIALAVPGTAAAAVHTNPDSPANKEYQIPLDQAKGAAGTTSSAKTLPDGQKVGDQAGSGSGLAVPIGIGIAVLAIGLGAGFALRSRNDADKPGSPGNG